MPERRTATRGASGDMSEIFDDLGPVGVNLLAQHGSAVSADDSSENQAGSIFVPLAFSVSQDGAINGVLQGAGRLPDGFDANSVPECIDAIWSTEVCERIKSHVKASIRNRRIQRLALPAGVSENLHELIFVPQGLDSVLVMLLDVSASRTAYSRVRELAYIDKATTLPNREYLLEELRRFMDIPRLKEGRAAVICLSVEHGNGADNTLSGKSQEIVLKELATRLGLELRNANRAEEQDFERYSVAARIDFRQYGVLLPSIESGADAESVAIRLIGSLEAPVKVGEREIKVSVRAGIALAPQDGNDAEVLLDNALSAMEDAQNGQDEPYKFYSGTVRLRALQRKDLELELKSALNRGEFRLHYLPIVEARTGTVVGVEALLRWPQAMFGSQPIHKVVKLAEHTGLIVPIGDWVVDTSVQQLGAWHEAGHSNLRLALNLSVQQFSRPAFAKRLTDTVERHEIAPNALDLEITEYLLFRDAMKNYATCNSLRDAGFRIVIDDFGTGACSLAHFSHSPSDAIKIDNSFVSNALGSALDRQACSAMTVMAHALGREVIAEGVETADQLDMLKEIGCDLFQGFLFCKPVPAKDIERYLTEPSFEHLATGADQPADRA